MDVYWTVTGFSLSLGHALQQRLGDFELCREHEVESATANKEGSEVITYVVGISSVEDDIVLGRLFFQEIQIGQTTMQALDMVPKFVEKCHFLIGTSESCDRVLVFVF